MSQRLRFVNRTCPQCKGMRSFSGGDSGRPILCITCAGKGVLATPLDVERCPLQKARSLSHLLGLVCREQGHAARCEQDLRGQGELDAADACAVEAATLERVRLALERLSTAPRLPARRLSILEAA